MYPFCTQSSFAETYLSGGFQQLFEKCPGLKGVVLITASEIMSHCYANVDMMNLLGESFKHRTIQCPRCKQQTAAQVVADVIARIHNGIRAASVDANIVAWNWSWGMYEPSPQASIIETLPDDVIILCDMRCGPSWLFEAAWVIRIGGKSEHCLTDLGLASSALERG